ncbi:MAG: VanZ family protein [Phycisphaerae bacterium]|nr:VanZ family protein [Phycisphaerae bacterium]
MQWLSAIPEATSTRCRVLIAVDGFGAVVLLTHVPQSIVRHPSWAETAEWPIHATLYCLLTWLLLWLSRSSCSWFRTTTALLSVVLLAAADEVTQDWTGRAASLGDWLADMIGAILAATVWLWRRRACDRKSCDPVLPDHGLLE